MIDVGALLQQSENCCSTILDFEETELQLPAAGENFENL
jgi:hypothetical protein